MHARQIPLLLMMLAGHLAAAEPDKGLPLAQSGATGYRIALAADASEPERHAAAELASFLGQVTGAAFPLAINPPADSGPLIVVGSNKLIATLAPGLSLEGLGAEGFVIESRGPHLVLAGGRPRGTLYAVYTFLEDQVGCRWWSSKVSTIPHRPTLIVPPLHDRQVPVLESREPFAFDSYDGDWSARNKCNGHSSRLESKHGGKIEYQGFVHTFNVLVPPEEFFATHPEYFSEINGTRSADHSQLCLSNREVVDLVTARVLALLEKAPPSTIVSVSQNDWHGWCDCKECKAATVEEGGVSGPLLRFVNQVAERVGKVRPDAAIDTLAYQMSRQPPRLVKPLPNVIVRLCSIECSFAKPLGTAEQNRKFAADIEGWSKICQRLYIWDYVTDFAHYVQPHPNLRVLQPNISYFVEHGVKGIFEQGSYQSPGGEMQELRSWLLAKLLWNPKADTSRLIDEFIAGYYGPAAPEIRRYLDLMHDEVAKSSDFLACYSPTTAAFLSQPVIAKADAVLTAAEQLAADTGDANLLQRVRVTRLPVQYVMMQRESAWRRSGPPWQPSLSGQALRERFFATAAAEHMTHINEGRSMDDFRKATFLPQRRTPPPPPGCESLAADQWIDWQDDEFSLYQPGNLATITPDPAASDGVAARMPGNHREWAIQLPLEIPSHLRKDGRKWRMAVSVRVEHSGSNGPAFSYGCYDQTQKTNFGGGVVNLSDIKSDGYAVYEIGNFPAGADRYLWIAPAANGDNVQAVWVDRFFLVTK